MENSLPGFTPRLWLGLTQKGVVPTRRPEEERRRAQQCVLRQSTGPPRCSADPASGPELADPHRSQSARIATATLPHNDRTCTRHTSSVAPRAPPADLRGRNFFLIFTPPLAPPSMDLHIRSSAKPAIGVHRAISGHILPRNPLLGPHGDDRMCETIDGGTRKLEKNSSGAHAAPRESARPIQETLAP